MKYLSIVFALIKKNFTLKYKQTILGLIWSLLHPAVFLIIFITVFSNIFKHVENYPLYVLSGIIFFIFFSETTSRLSHTFIQNNSMLRSYNIPKIIYSIAELGSELISLIIGLIPFLVIMYFMNMELSFNLLYIIPIILLFSLFTYSIGLILGSLNVFFRDVGLLWTTLRPALFYLSPIAYTFEIVPEKFKILVVINPMYHFLVIIRDVLYFNRPPTLRYLIICLIITSISFIIGILIYKFTQKHFISNI